jgi:hypothetical protein
LNNALNHFQSVISNDANANSPNLQQQLNEAVTTVSLPLADFAEALTSHRWPSPAGSDVKSLAFAANAYSNDLAQGASASQIRTDYTVMLLMVQQVQRDLDSISRATSSAPPRSRLHPFVGTWYVHDGGITISQDGAGSAEWRTFTQCSSSPPPCDAFVGNAIYDGGMAAFHIVSVSGNVATAVGTSIFSSSVFNGRFQLSLLPNGEVTVRRHGVNAQTAASGYGTFCGPHAPAGACGA